MNAYLYILRVDPLIIVGAFVVSLLVLDWVLECRAEAKARK